MSAAAVLERMTGLGVVLTADGADSEARTPVLQFTDLLFERAQFGLIFFDPSYIDERAAHDNCGENQIRVSPNRNRFPSDKRVYDSDKAREDCRQPRPDIIYEAGCVFLE